MSTTISLRIETMQMNMARWQ